jgi:hypothetical protein
MAINDRDVDAGGAVTEAEFVQNQGIRTLASVQKQAPKRRCSEICIP